MKTFAVCAVLLVLAAVPALAQEPTPLPLSLRDAVAQAIERNIDIAVARLDPQLQAQDVTVADAAFEPLFEASGGYTKSTTEPSDLFSPRSTENLSGQAAFTDPLRYGASWGLSLDYNDSSSAYPAGADEFGFFPDQIGSSLSVNYQQSLLRNFGLDINRTAIEQASLAQKISEEDLRGRILDTVEQVELSYWTLVGARRQVEVARASLDLAKDFLRQTKIKVEVGTLPPIEITTADAEVASREEAVIVTENAVRNAEDVLRALLRFEETSPDWSRPIEPTDRPGFEPVPVDLAQALETAYANRTEISAARLAARTAELTARFRENQTRPDLRVQASYTLSGNNYDYERRMFDTVNQNLVPCSGDPSQYCFELVPGTVEDVTRLDGDRWDAFSEIPSRDNDRWFVGATFALPIGNRAAKAEEARAKIAVDQANLRVEAARQAVRVDVRDAVRALDTASRRVATTRANVVLQRKKLEAEQKRYENGLSTAFQVLTFQTDLRDAESREITAIVDYNRALAQLGRAQGTLLEQRGITTGQK